MPEICHLLSASYVDHYFDELQELTDSGRLVQLMDRNPLHIACMNSDITLRIIQFLHTSWLESASISDEEGDLPIHYLCRNMDLDEAESVKILTYLLGAYPDSVTRENSQRELPIHTAAILGMSLEFIEMLYNEYPESLMILGGEDMALPIHIASGSNRLDIVMFMFEKHPESINIESGSGYLPINYSADGLGPDKDEVIKYLLMKDPLCASEPTSDGQYPLHQVCIHGEFSAIQLLFDAYPDAINETDGEDNTPLQRARAYYDMTYTHYNEEEEHYFNYQKVRVISFLEAQQRYACITLEEVTKLDQHGWTPLHRALVENASLGSIKLLVKKNASAIRVVDYNLALPLHIACEFSSALVVQYLMKMLDERTWSHLDANKDSVLHYACRGGNCEVVKYLLDEQSPYVSEHNNDEKLPIQLFCESWSLSPSSTHIGGDEASQDVPESLAWICDICKVAKFKTREEAETHEKKRCAFNQNETLWRLLRAHPDTVKYIN